MRRRTIIQASTLMAMGIAAPASTFASNRIQQIGVNCFDLFYGCLVDPRRVRKPRERLKELAGLGIPFVRFAASPFWPSEWRIYQQQRSRYMDLMSEVASEAADAGVKLVPSLFWNPPSVSDFVGEPTAAWQRPDSRTLRFAQSYISDVLTAYGDGSTVLFWEFGNEFNVNLDLPDGRRWWPKVNQQMGTPARRTEQDVITTRGYQALQESFCRWVKGVLPNAKTGTGSDRPHPSAYNLSIGRSDTDTKQEFRRAIQLANPSCSEVASLHLYPDKVGAYFGKTSDVRSILQEARAATKESGQTLFLGEFGVSEKSSPSAERKTFDTFLDAIEFASVDLAALWVFDFIYQPDFSVTVSNERSWQLQEVVRWNEAAARRPAR